MSSKQARIAGWLGRRLGFGIALLACLFQPALGFSQKNPDPGQIVDFDKMQTARQTNERIAELALAEAGKQHDYVIGPGDLLGIEVFDVPELSRDVRVNESGFVSLPLIPVKVQAAGLTSFQFQDKVTELLQSNG